MIAFEQKARNM